MKMVLSKRNNKNPERRKVIKTAFRTLLAGLLLTMLAACAGHDNKEVIRTELANCDDGGDRVECQDSAYLVLAGHKAADDNATRARLGFVEFDDLGFQHHPQAVKHVFSEIDALNNRDKPLLIVMFIHGWHHNASGDDSNVLQFKQFLIDLQHEENTISNIGAKRQVMGVYVGWRGESNSGVLSPVTYRSRKEAGLRVGQYGLQEVLAELSRVRQSNRQNRLIAVGHSFGGGVLYSAVMQNLVDKVVSTDPAISGSDENRNFGIIGKAYGDLVILMNPALEAGRVETLHRRLANATFDRCQSLVLASFTSEKDEALSKFFPKGQNVFFRDDLSVAKNAQLVTSAYGQFEDYRTHELSCQGCTYKVSSGENYLDEDHFRVAARKWPEFRRTADAVFPVDNMSLVHYTKPGQQHPGLQPGTPVMNVFVRGDNLIKNHNDIWGDNFLKFVRALVGMEFRRSNQCQP